MKLRPRAPDPSFVVLQELLYLKLFTSLYHLRSGGRESLTHSTTYTYTISLTFHLVSTTQIIGSGVVGV